MTDSQLQAFRALALLMQDSRKPANWQWIGPHMSQRMFGITQERAQEYAARHGGTAREMVQS